MNKDTLLHYWRAVRAVTDEVKHGHKNTWGEDNGGVTDSLRVITYFERKKKSMNNNFVVDEVAVYRFNGSCIIAVNGSDNDRLEWRSNFNAYPITRSMHGGFYEASKNVLREVLSLIGEPVPTMVVGHSRGGAIAQLMCHLAPYAMGCITFGSPRCFIVNAKPHFPHHRVHCKQDPVCHVPPAFIPPFWKSYHTSETVIDIDKGKKGIKQSHVNYGQSIIRWVDDDKAK